jgi:ATP-binding cassette subfamily B protein
VLEHGHIVEQGTHQQLLTRGGLYASMWNRQREADEAREKLALVADEEAGQAGPDESADPEAIVFGKTADQIDNQQESAVRSIPASAAE